MRYLFSNTRWKNPQESVEDMEQMRTAWKELCDSSLAFSAQCRCMLCVRAPCVCMDALVRLQYVMPQVV